MEKIGQFYSEAMLPGSSKRVSQGFLLSEKRDVAALPSPRFSLFQTKENPQFKLSSFCGEVMNHILLCYSPKLRYKLSRVIFNVIH